MEIKIYTMFECMKYNFCDWRVGWPDPAGRKASGRLRGLGLTTA